jgi:hypothetical protein
LILIITDRHAAAALEAESLIERDDVVVAEQVDHVDLSESLSQPPDEFGADAPVLPVSDHLEVWDVCSGDAIAEGRDETDDPPWILLHGEYDMITSVQDRKVCREMAGQASR